MLRNVNIEACLALIFGFLIIQHFLFGRQSVPRGDNIRELRAVCLLVFGPRIFADPPILFDAKNALAVMPPLVYSIEFVNVADRTFAELKFAVITARDEFVLTADMIGAELALAKMPGDPNLPPSLH